ncbi:MAG: hypothetical protein IKB98_06840 [Clostridia bacterium]|nr:hypothetical protein [Clostridia bacterium]
MNLIALVILLFTVACLLFGALFGMMRGRNRSILRLIIVLICGVAAIFLKDVVVGILMDLDFVKEFMAEMVTEFSEMEALTEVIMAFIRILFGLFVYLLLFFVLQFVTWMIVYPICKIFVKKEGMRKAKREAAQNPQEHQGKEKIKVKKKKGWGSLIGLGQGLLVAFFICAPLTGFAFQAYGVLAPVKDMMAEMDNSESAYVEELDSVSQYNATFDAGPGGSSSESGSSSDSDMGMLNDIIDLLGGFVDSAPGKVFNAVGGWYANIVTTDTETDISLENIVEVIKTTSTVANEATNLMELLEDFDPEAEDATTTMRAIGDSLIKIGNTVDTMSQEGVKIMNDILADIESMITENVDDEDADEVEELFNEIKVTDLKLAPAGNAIKAIADYMDDETMTQDKANKIVNGIAQNKFMVTLAGETTLMDLSESADRQYFEIAIANQTQYQSELRVMFGLA